MKISLADSQIELAAKQTLRLDGARGLRVVCLRGELWLTQHHDRRDVFLQTCQSFTLDRDGLALLSAMQDSTVRLEAPAVVRDRAAGIGFMGPERDIFLQRRLTAGLCRRASTSNS